MSGERAWGVTLRLAASVEVPGRARETLRQHCGHLPEKLVDDALLLTSEIVTNSVQHAGGMLTVAIECDGQCIAVAITDPVSDEPVPRHAAESDTGGRGMQLVDAVASAWGWRPTSDGEGKVVWFRVSA